MRPFRSITLPALLAAGLLPLAAHAQIRIGTGPVADLYEMHCSVCHGSDLANGLGGTLLGEWDHVSEDRTIESIVANGLPELGMFAFDDVLSAEEIRSLAVFIEEKRLQARDAAEPDPLPPDAVFQTRHHAFRLEEVCTSGESIFWAIDFLPGDRILLTQFDGRLRIFEDGELGPPVEGTPEVWRFGQGGLLDVGVHPDYRENGWIYLSYSEQLGKQADRDAGFTTVVRGRIRDGRWVDEELLFRVDPEFARSAGAHFGSRFVFRDGYLFFGVGDRGAMDQAQELARPNGKIHRIHDDGRIPDDNPFVDVDGAYPTVWTLGNRNPQGLTMHPETGAIWESEHGPRGGDEINVIERGRNYGWPVITHGINYNGKPITAETEREGMEQPATHFTPSIAICGIDFYEGDRFPEWQHHLFVGGLASEELWRLRTEGSRVVERERILRDQGRIRDVACGPDGTLYLLLNRNKRAGPGALYKLVPATGVAAGPATDRPD